MVGVEWEAAGGSHLEHALDALPREPGLESFDALARRDRRLKSHPHALPQYLEHALEPLQRPPHLVAARIGAARLVPRVILERATRHLELA